MVSDDIERIIEDAAWAARSVSDRRLSAARDGKPTDALIRAENFMDEALDALQGAIDALVEAGE